MPLIVLVDRRIDRHQPIGLGSRTALGSKARVLVVTMHGEREYMRAWRAAGTAGYILKSGYFGFELRSARFFVCADK